MCLDRSNKYATVWLQFTAAVGEMQLEGCTYFGAGYWLDTGLFGKLDWLFVNPGGKWFDWFPVTRLGL